MQLYRITTQFCLAITIILILQLSVNNASAQVTKPPVRILQSASELDYPPFAIVKPDNTADGFSVELLQAVTKAAGMDVKFTVGPWHDIKQKLIDRKLDVLPLVSYSDERDKLFDFTAPYLRMHGAIFVRKGEKTIRSKSDLKGKEVLVMRGDTAHEYAMSENLTDKLVLTDTFAEAMQLLSAGSHDAVIIQQLVGFQLIKELGLPNLVSVNSLQDDSLKPTGRPLSNFEQKFCIAVQEGDKELLALLNEGLAIIIANGKYGDLYNKWFGPILPQPPVSISQIIRYVLYILVPLTMLILIVGFWYLKRQVKIQTAHLNEEIEGRKTTETELRIREKEQIALNKASRAILRNEEFIITARNIFDAASELIGSTAGYVALLSSDGNKNEVLFLEAGGKSCWVDPDLPMPIRGLRAECYKTGKVVFENDFYNSEWMQYMPAGHVGLNNVLFAPLVISGKTMGIMGMANKDGDFDNGDAKMAASFGELAAIALRNSRLLEQLEYSEMRFRELFAHMSSGVVIYEPVDNGKDFIIIDINEAGCLSTNKIREALIGQQVTEVYPAVEAMGILDALRQVLKTGESMRVPASLYNDNKLIFWAENYIYMLKTGELVAIFDDVTDHKIMEDEKVAIESRLRQAEKMEAVGTLAGGIAHDFNNILAAIIGYSELALYDARAGKIEPDDIEQIIAAADRAKKLVQQILAYSRKNSATKEMFNVNEIVARTVNLLSRTMPRMIKLERKLLPETELILGNPAQIEQIIYNLASNAKDAMPDGGELLITTENVFLDEEYRGGPQSLDSLAAFLRW